MARLKVNGRELLVKQMNTARNRDIIELQRQTGLKVNEIPERAKESDLFAMICVSFLTQHNAGFRVKFDDLLDGTPDIIGTFEADPGDETAEPAKVEGEADADPTQAVTTTDAAPSESLAATPA